MVVTGLVLGTVKRRARQAVPEKEALGSRLIERLNVATIAGLPVVMAAFLWGNRLLPLGIAERNDWEARPVLCRVGTEAASRIRQAHSARMGRAIRGRCRTVDHLATDKRTGR
jgi:hypothetical protein